MYGLIVAEPGETIQVTVSITTLHRVTTVKLHIAPSNESYVSSISPIFFEVIDGTVMAVAEVSVPSSATNGDVSAFLVSAVNEEDKQYAVFGVFVIEEPLFNNTDEVHYIDWCILLCLATKISHSETGAVGTKTRSPLPLPSSSLPFFPSPYFSEGRGGEGRGGEGRGGEGRGGRGEGTGLVSFPGAGTHTQKLD